MTGNAVKARERLKKTKKKQKEPFTNFPNQKEQCPVHLKMNYSF